jgi:hypothetical protein
MKKVTGMLLVASILFASCGSVSRREHFKVNPKPYYKTAEGKKKQKYYNEIQYGGKSAATMKKDF